MAGTNFSSSGFMALYASIFIAFLNSAINGFDNSLMSGIIIMDGFKSSFGDLTGSVNPSMNAILFSLIQIGAITAFPFIGFVNDKFGRLRGMQFGSLFVIVGAILEISTTNLGLFCFGRYLIGAGVCFVVTSAPTYVVEVAHPVFRGRATAFYNCGWHVGAIPASVILYALDASESSRKSDLSWRLPCGLQGAWSIVVFIGCFFMPESPRWLVSAGRVAEAKAFLTKYHASGDENDDIVTDTLSEIQAAIENEKAQSQTSFAALFNSRANRYRSFIVIGVGVFSQTAGNWIASYFQSQVLPYFGITSTEQILLFGIITACISLISSLTGSVLVDKTGRRPYLVYGTASYVFFFTLLTILLAIYNQNEVTDKPQGPFQVGIFGFVVLQIFGIAYSVCWTSINALYPVEVLQYSTRAKGMAMCQAVVNLANIIQSYILSYGMNAYKWKFFSFYVLFNSFAFIMIFLYFPETKGRTLEELDEIFQSPNPVKASLEPKAITHAFLKDGKASA